MGKRKTTEEFVKQAESMHGDTCGYEESKYVDSRTPVKIYCKIHKRFFWQRPDQHLRPGRCPSCPDCITEKRRAGSKRAFKTNEEFAEAAKSIHGDSKYGYDESNYINTDTPVKIYCNECKEYFYQTPYSHLIRKYGCPTCAAKKRGEEQRVSPEEWIERFRSVHGTNFDYSESDFGPNSQHIKIRCKKHNTIFYQTPHQHLNSLYGGCEECMKEGVGNRSILLEEFKTRLINLYGVDRFDLDSIKGYRNLSEPIFIYDRAADELINVIPRNLLAQYRSEDYICSVGAFLVKNWLLEKNINFSQEYYVKDIKKNKVGVRIDFRLENYKNQEIWIEYNGEQHYNTKMKFHNFSEKDFQNQQDRDKRVRLYCKENGIKLIEIPYTLGTSESISEFLEKVLLNDIDPTTLIDYDELYK